MYFIGLDVHKKTISYCVKDAAGRVHQGEEVTDGAFTTPEAAPGKLQGTN